MYICFSSVAVQLPVPALCTLVGFFRRFPIAGYILQEFGARIGSGICAASRLSAPLECVQLCCDAARVFVHLHSVSR